MKVTKAIFQLFKTILTHKLVNLTNQLSKPLNFGFTHSTLYNRLLSHTKQIIINQYFKRLGVKSPLDEVPSMTLGAFELTPFATNQMYQTLSNDGRYIPLHTVTSVVTAEKRVAMEKKRSFSLSV